MIVDLSLQKESSQSRETLPTLPRKFQLIVQGDPTATVVGTARVFGTNPATAQIITEFNLAALLALSANPGSLEDSASQKVKKPILSNREREIAILVGQGFKNKEISEALFIGDQTVKNHLGNIFYKLKIEDRWQLMPSDPDSILNQENAIIMAYVVKGGTKTAIEETCKIPEGMVAHRLEGLSEQAKEAGKSFQEYMQERASLLKSQNSNEPVVYESISRESAALAVALLEERAEKFMTEAPTKLDLSSLTDRERAIVGLLRQGFSNKQICEDLFIAEDTFKNHQHNIFSKLGISNIEQLILHDETTIAVTDQAIILALKHGFRTSSDIAAECMLRPNVVKSRLSVFKTQAKEAQQAWDEFIDTRAAVYEAEGVAPHTPNPTTRTKAAKNSEP